MRSLCIRVNSWNGGQFTPIQFLFRLSYFKLLFYLVIGYEVCVLGELFLNGKCQEIKLLILRNTIRI